MEPFKLINSKTVYSGRIFRVEVVEMRLPDGKVRSFDLVQHSGAVALVPVDNEGRILFVRQYRLGAGRDLLELPAGTLEAGEDPDSCAAREIREETGLAAKKIQKLGAFFMAPGYSSEYLHIYLATGLYPDRLTGDEDEFLELEAIPVEKVYEMVRAGQLEDGKSLAALLLAQPWLNPS